MFQTLNDHPLVTVAVFTDTGRGPGLAPGGLTGDSADGSSPDRLRPITDESAMPVSAWICPSCDRRVPRTVDVCRCGHEWTGSEEPVADPPRDAAVAARPPGPSRLPTIVAGGAIVLVGAVIAFVALGRTAPSAALRPTRANRRVAAA